ncbi:MAG TPA: hypothetical protein VK550_02205 [Polyangiaceae bacterium]|nr:hypothetical protein [Polyangiaceae bacterium]
MNTIGSLAKTSNIVRGLAPSLALAACVALSGCGSGDGYYHHGGTSGRSFSLPTCPSAKTPVRVVGIETDAQLTTEAGKGAGVLLEYMNGGHWHIATVCDTSVSGYRCDFDVTAQAIGGKVSNLLSEELESDDVATSYCSDTALLGVTTGADFDGIWFDTVPGATVRVTAALGQTIYDNIFFWVSEGVVHEDANANPIELTPTAL